MLGSRIVLWRWVHDAGAVVVKDIPANVVAMGVPARVTRKRQSGEKCY